jgi:hypothetical protein
LPFFCLRRPGGALFEKTAPPGPPRKNFSLKAVMFCNFFLFPLLKDVEKGDNRRDT